MANVTGGTAPKADPLLTFMFSIQGTIALTTGNVELDGYFTEIGGIEEEVEVIKFEAVGERKGSNEGKPVDFLLPGRSSRGEISLKRGFTTDTTCWEWWQLVKAGEIDKARTDITITMYNRQYQALVQWHLLEAWPSKITGPGFQADSSDFGLEELTLVYQSLDFELI